MGESVGLFYGLGRSATKNILEKLVENTGVKINAKRIPKIIDNKIGFNKRKDKTTRVAKIIVVIIFLK